mgnify:CR=1 FL=1
MLLEVADRGIVKAENREADAQRNFVRGEICADRFVGGQFKNIPELKFFAVKRLQ